MTETKALTHGAHHIGLTVPDLAKTQSFFKDTLGYQQLGEVPDYPAVFAECPSLAAPWQIRFMAPYPLSRAGFWNCHKSD